VNALGIAGLVGLDGSPVAARGLGVPLRGAYAGERAAIVAECLLAEWAAGVVPVGAYVLGESVRLGLGQALLGEDLDGRGHDRSDLSGSHLNIGHHCASLAWAMRPSSLRSTPNRRASAAPGIADGQVRHGA